MHLTSYENAARFVEAYPLSQGSTVAELGSQIVEGQESLRQLFSDDVKYLGYDFASEDYNLDGLRARRFGRKGSSAPEASPPEADRELRERVSKRLHPLQVTLSELPLSRALSISEPLQGGVEAVSPQHGTARRRGIQSLASSECSESCDAG